MSQISEIRPDVADVARACHVCGKRTDSGHLKCSWCRSSKAREKRCTACGTVGRYKAKGLCIKHYFKKLRFDKSRKRK